MYAEVMPLVNGKLKEIAARILAITLLWKMYIKSVVVHGWKHGINLMGMET